MKLKCPAPCCRVKTLTWSVPKQFFVCRCGKMEADELGQLVARDKSGGRVNCKRGRPRKSTDKNLPRHRDRTFVPNFDDWN